MDLRPLVVGLAVGAGDSAVGKWFPATGTLGSHRFLIYRLVVLGLGAYGEYAGKFSADLDYSLMTAATALITQDVPAALSGGGFGAFGALAAPAYRGYQGDFPTIDENRAGTGAQSFRRAGLRYDPIDGTPVSAYVRDGSVPTGQQELVPAWDLPPNRNAKRPLVPNTQPPTAVG
jgi:hypothetical protein